MKRFLLVDDQVVVRYGISTLLTKIQGPAELREAYEANSTPEEL